MKNLKEMSKSQLIDIINILEAKYNNLKKDYKNLAALMHIFIKERKEIKNILNSKENE